MLKQLYQALREAGAPSSPFKGCLVYGEEPLLYDHLGRGLRALSLHERTLETFDCAAGSFQDFVVTAAAPSLFASRKVVHLTKLPSWSRADQEKLLAWIKEEAASGPIDYLFAEGRKFAGNRFPVTSLKKHLLCLKSGRLRPWEAAAWLKSRLKRMDVKVADGVLEELVALHDGSLSLIENELEKLALYVGPGGRIDKEVVERLGVDSGGGNIFKFCDLVGQGQVVAALEILDRLLQSRVAALKILAMVIRQFRLLCRLVELKARAGGRPSVEQMARELKVNPFVVKNLLPQTTGVDGLSCARAFAILSEVDRNLKSAGSPAEILLTQMVLDLCALKQPLRQAGRAR